MKDFIHTMLLTVIALCLCILLYRDFEREKREKAEAAEHAALLAAAEARTAEAEALATEALAKVEALEAEMVVAATADPGEALVKSLFGFQESALSTMIESLTSAIVSPVSVPSTTTPASSATTSSSPEEALGSVFAGLFGDGLANALPGCVPTAETVEAIEALTISETASNEEARGLLRALSELSTGQSCKSSSDPQMAKVKLLGTQHVEIMLDYVESPIGFYVKHHLPTLVQPQNTAAIVERLRRDEDLIELVNELGITKEAAEVIADRLPFVQRSNKDDWIDAALTCKDPVVYKPLIAAMASGPFSFDFDEKYYRAIALPDFPVGEFHHELWQQKGRHGLHSADQVQLVTKAAEYGDTSALLSIANELNKIFRNDNSNSQRSKLEQAIARLVAEGETVERKIQWVLDHIGEISFDSSISKFVLDEEKTDSNRVDLSPSDLEIIAPA